MVERRRSLDGDAVGDPEIVARIAKGDTSALGVLFDRYDRDVRRVVSRLGISAADVDDVVQATFLDVLRASAGYDGRENARPWLIGLAVMQVRRHRRSLARIAARVTAWAREPSPHPTTPEEETAVSQAAMRARRALDALSPKKREVLVLVTIEGLSGEEAAKLLGIPVATVWTRLHHARNEIMAAAFEEES
ncbi:MAG: RNA polymerase sigma factor [Deltaproteobacteria bacterium]|nr:RNA polymerase sigma factor [Deltaproteobacteria bacterium]